jgi:hypothetical protein
LVDLGCIGVGVDAGKGLRAGADLDTATAVDDAGNPDPKLFAALKLIRPPVTVVPPE